MAATPTVANPVLPGCHPDPSICRVGEDYYLVTSTFEYLPGLPVMRSRDLVSWETIGHVIDREGMLDYTGIPSSGGLYAPTIRHDGERFWLVCTHVDPAEESRFGNFLVTATDPAGPWSDPVWLDADGIDPSVVFDDDGRVWMHGTRLARQQEWHDQTEVWVREFSRESMSLVGEEHLVWRGALHGAVWAEGPHLYAIDGRWYLVAAEAGTAFHHAVCVARAEAVTGPYEGSRGNPVITHRHLGTRSDVIGVGHADLVTAPDGSWLAVLLAMRTSDGEHYPLGRETFLCPVEFEDGWPIFAPGMGRLPREVEVPWVDELPADGSWQPDSRAGGSVPASDPRWTGIRALPSTVATVRDDAWVLPVRRASLRELEPVSFLGLRQQHADVDAEVELDVSALAEGESAGFVLRQSERDHAVVSVTRSAAGLEVSAVHVRGGEERVLASARAVEGDVVRLGVRARGDDYDLVADDAVVARVDARELDSASTGGFLGVWFGVVATSHGAAASGEVRVLDSSYVPA